MRAIIIAVIFCIGCSPPSYDLHPNQFERNMRQSGVNDIQWPINQRVEWAERHGMPIPKR